MTNPADATLFSTSLPHAAAYIVYINGIEVPTKSVSMRYGVWQIPEMQIEMVADPTIARLGAEDRVQVAVFYYDDTAVSPEVAPAFRMFGEGEVVGWGYRNTSGGRSITFTVINQIAIFKQLFTQFMTTVNDMMGALTGPNGSVGIQNATNELVYPYSLFTQGLIPGSAGGAIQRPFDFLFNTVRALISTQVPPTQRTVPAANFFTRWARLNNFHNRFIATPFFDDADAYHPNVFPVLKALQDTSAVDIITRNLIPQIQNADSLWGMLETVYATVLMEIAMIPGMPLVTVDLASSHVLETNFAEHKLVDSFGAWVTSDAMLAGRTQRPKRVANYFAKPQMFFSVPPTCNAIFPSQIKTLAYDEDYASQPTRLYFDDATLTKLLKVPTDGVAAVLDNIRKTAYPYEADLGLKLESKYGTFNGKNFLLWAEEYFKGPVMDRRDVPPWLFMLSQAQTAAPASVTADGEPVAVKPPFFPAVTVSPRPSTGPATAVPGERVMRTNANVGRVPQGGGRVFTTAVEQLRGAVERSIKATGAAIPPDLALAWIAEASGGDPNATVRGTGFWQLSDPDLAAASKRYPEGVPAHVATNPQSPAALDVGVTYLVRARQAAEADAKTAGVTWADADLWRLAAFRETGQPAYATQALHHATTTLGHPPTSWEEMYFAVQPDPPFDGGGLRLLTRATAVGGVVAGASGVMTTLADPRPQPAPAIKEAPTAAGAAATRTDVPAAPTPTPIAPATADAIDRNNLNVNQLYAKYEFFRERFARRNGSATLAWNPYVVPGFPATIFDQRASRLDIACYITTVNHTMTHDGQRSTAISFMYGRQLQEQFDLMRKEFDGGETAAGSAPAEVIRDVRKIVQSFSQAETFYQRLFFGAQRLYGKDAAFDFRKIVGYATDDPSNPEQIFIVGPDEATQDTLVVATANAQILTKARDAAERTVLQFTQHVKLYDDQIARLRAAPPTALGAQFNQAAQAAQTSDQIGALVGTFQTIAGLANTPANAGDAFAATDDATVIRAVSDLDRLIDPEVSDGLSGGDLGAEVRTAFNDLTVAQMIAIRDRLKVQLAAAQGQFLAQDLRLKTALGVIEASQNTSGLRKVAHNLEGGRELVPLPNAALLFERYDAALQYNWRPICTLDEYIIFHASAGENVIPAAGHPQSVGARYYERVRRFQPAAEDFVPPNTAASMLATQDALVQGLGPDNFPQTRAAWDEALLAYRQNALGVKAPRT